MFETMADITDCTHLVAPGRLNAIVAWYSISLLVSMVFFVFGSAKIHTIGRLESVISQKCGFVWDINVLNNAKSNFVLFLLSCIDEKCLFLSEFSRIYQ